MKQEVKYAISGATAGAINGLLGTGGGMLLVPMLSGWCGVEGKEAFATSVCVIWPLCLLSAAVYAIRGTLPLSASWPYLLGGLFGGILAGLLMRRLSPTLLHRLFGLLLLWGAVRIL